MKNFKKLKFIFVGLYIVFIFAINITIDKFIDNQQTAKYEWIAHTNMVIIEAEKLLTHLIDAETGQRGFLLTKDKKYLEPYYNGRNKTKDCFDLLFQLTLDNKIQTNRLQMIEKLIKLKFDELNATIETKDYAKALNIIKQDHGKKYMDNIRDIIQAFIKEEHKLLKKREKEFDEVSLDNFLFIKIVLYLLFGIMFYFIYLTLVQKKEIELINAKLKNEVEIQVQENMKKDKQLFIQTRLAQMGEMISMIAHQWRQPLGAISATSIDLQMKIQLDKVGNDEESRDRFCKYVKKSLTQIDSFVETLTSTIDDFRNFYKPDKPLDKMHLHEVCDKALKIVKATLEGSNIKVITDYQCDNKVNLFSSEIQQVVLSIIKNAQDNIIEKNVQNPYIKIMTTDCQISICDNGGGIPEDIIDNIYDPYFSTKDVKNGTGLGLYMSKTIVEEHHNGKLTAHNKDNGVCFDIKIGELRK